jgi:hypothetical protein
MDNPYLIFLSVLVLFMLVLFLLTRSIQRPTTCPDPVQHPTPTPTPSGPQQPTPTPQQPIPTPQQPIPTPQQPIPTPQQPIPTPQQPIPTPQQPIPTPQQPIPTPQQPIPTPQQPIPTPQTTPEPPQPTPALITPAFIPTTWIDASGVDFNSAGRGVAYGNGVWIAAGLDATSSIKSSSDNGVTWTDMNNLLPTGSGGSGIYGIATDGKGRWVAVGNQNTAIGGKTIIFSSDNGVTWNSSTNGFNLNNGYTDRGWAVAYANNVWMAVGHYNTSIGYERWIKVATTFDPVTGPAWVDKPAGTGAAAVGFGPSNPASCVAYGNGRWCVGGQDLNSQPRGSIIYSDDNGTTWTKSTGTFKGMCLGIATDGSGNWVAVGYLGTGDTKTIKYSSDNGATWTDTISLAANLFTMGQSVTYQPLSSGGIWVATGSGNSQTIMYSNNNGYSWNPAGTNRFTSAGYSVYFNVDRWVAVGNGGSSSIKYSLVEPSPQPTPTLPQPTPILPTTTPTLPTTTPILPTTTPTLPTTTPTLPTTTPTLPTTTPTIPTTTPTIPTTTPTLPSTPSYSIQIKSADESNIIFDGFFNINTSTNRVESFYDSSNPTINILSTGTNGEHDYIYQPGWLSFNGNGCNITRIPYFYENSIGDFNMYGSGNSNSNQGYIDGTPVLFNITPLY